MKCAIYVRVSTDGQKDNYSIQRQREDGILFAQQKQLEYEVYEDVQSGADISRKNWRRLWDDVAGNLISTIWVGAVDRFSRNETEGALAIDLMIKHNIAFYVVGIYNDPRNPNTRLLLTVQLGIAAYEKAMILQRTYNGKIKSWDAGKRKSHSVIGYVDYYNESGERLFKIDEKEAEIVRYIFNLYEGGLSLKGVAQKLNDEGYKTKNSGKRIKNRNTGETKIIEGKFENTTVNYIIRRPEYKGKTWNALKTELLDSVYYPSIISEEQWDKVNNMMNDLSPKRNRNGIRVSNYELSGIIKCGKCGASYYRNKQHQKLKDGWKIYNKYMHKSDTTIQKQCKNKPKNIMMDNIEDAISVLFINTFSNTTELQSMFDKMKDNKEIDKIGRDIERFNFEIEEVNKRKVNLLDMVESGVIAMNDVKDRMSKINNEIEQWESLIEKSNKELRYQNKEYREALNLFSRDILGEFIVAEPKEKRKMYSKMIRSLTVEDLIVKIEFITGRTIRFELNNKPAWLTGQIENYRAGLYNEEWISEWRNRRADFWAKNPIK